MKTPALVVAALLLPTAAAAGPLCATIFCIEPAPGPTVPVTFSGTFDANAPLTRYSAPGADFTVRFNTPLRFQTNGLRVVEARYISGGSTQRVAAFFNPTQLASGEDAFSISFSDRFTFGGTTFNVTSRDDFFRQTSRTTGRVLRGSYAIDSAEIAVVNFIFGAIRSPIMNLSELRIGSLPRTVAPFEPRLALTTGVGALQEVPEAGTASALFAGLGLLGVAVTRRRRRAPAAGR